MKKFKRVFQIGFDIAEKDGIYETEREMLADQIRETIDNFYDIRGKELNFTCVNGIYSFEDMSHAYGDVEMKAINQ